MLLPRCSKHLIALHCIRFLNRHASLPSLFKSHCCPLIIMCSPSSVDKKSILPLPFIATDESFTFGGEKGPMDIVFPGLREPWVAFHLQRALLHQVRRQRLRSIKALLPQPCRTIPDPWAPLAVSDLLPCISLLPLQRARGCTPAELLVSWQSQTLHRRAKGLILLCLFPTGRQGASHTTNECVGAVKQGPQS